MRNIRKTGSLILAAAVILVTGCKNTNSNAQQTITGIANSLQNEIENMAQQANEPQVAVNGNTITYGDHSYTVSGEFNDSYKVPTAFVTFTNFPANYEEFEAVYNGLLGKSIQGTAAMIPMAIELYARDAAVGEKCFNLLCNGPATVSGIVRILKTKLIPSQYGPSGDPYIQRYMAAALLKGANANNAYSPDMPYTVEMAASPNGVHNVTGGTDTFIYILADGWDTRQRSVEIFQAEGSPLYKVYNCPSCYTQCKNIKGEWAGLQ
ncbi:MAG: hypothetical protein J6X91_02630 [Bacteroidales bacterium]|nr:hypothetical protein [Bacteroidales bacterium]MBP5517546.1 hypothetical protein [Bacteroidales bacterium]